MSQALDTRSWVTSGLAVLACLRTAAVGEFAQVVPAKEIEPGYWTAPYCVYQDLEKQFWQVVGESGLSMMRQDYVDWRQNSGRDLNDPAWIAGASRDELSLLATAIRRGERFCDGTIAAAFENGVLAALLARLIEL